MPAYPPPPPRTPLQPPIKKAAALAYDAESDTAPKLVAKGKGDIAERIIALALEHNLPVRSDADLLEILDNVEVGTEIPLEVYAVVAEIFAFLYQTNQNKAATKANNRP